MALAFPYGWLVFLLPSLAAGFPVVSQFMSAQKEERNDVPSKVTFNGTQMQVNGVDFHMKGICWNPVPVGSGHPEGIDFPSYVEGDAKLMQEAGINVVRLYVTLSDLAVLDVLFAHGIYVINIADNWGGASIDNLPDVINPSKNHPGVLMWEIGNEWNYNGFYVGLSLEDGFQRVRDFAAQVKLLDTNHPVATVFGELPTEEHITELDGHIDVWALNVYRNNDFGDIFDKFQSRTSLPMYIGEYGADAWDSRNASGLVTQPYMGVEGSENFTAQADATIKLTEQINAASALNGGPCNGGFVFEFADEWWKSNGDNDDPASEPQRWVHDNTGSAPGGGPYPDQTFNEEWWGLTDINRTKRLAFTAYAAIAPPTRVVPTPTPTQPQYGVIFTVIGAVVILGLVAIGCAMQSSGEQDEPLTEMS